MKFNSIFCQVFRPGWRLSNCVPIVALVVMALACPLLLNLRRIGKTKGTWRSSSPW
jgi:hypothetical protein